MIHKTVYLCNPTLHIFSW